jgi:hypothetical protein
MAEFKQQYSQQFGLGADEHEQDYNKIQSIVDGVELRNAAQKDKNIEQWGAFSTTAAGWVDTWKANKSEQELADFKIRDWIGYPNSPEQQEIDDNDDAQLDAYGKASGETSDQLIKQGAPYTTVSRVTEMGGQPSWDRAVIDVKRKMSRYKTEVYGALKDPEKEYSLPNGETFKLRDLDKNTRDGKAKWAYALAVERRKFFINNGLHKYNTKLLAPYAFNAVQSDNAFLEGKEDAISIEASKEARDEAFEANFKNGQYDINKYFETVKRTVDGKNNYLDYKGAHAHLQSELLDKFERGEITETQIENILDTKIKGGPYDGKTLREAFPNVYGTNIGISGKGKGTFIAALQKSQTKVVQNNTAERKIHDDKIRTTLEDPQARAAAAKEAGISEQEYFANELETMHTIPPSLKRLHDRLYAEPASPDEASRAAEYLNVLWEANELHPEDHADIINRLPAKDREEWFRRANTQWKNKKTGAYQEHLTKIINPIKKKLGAIEVDNQLQATGASGDVIIELENKYKQEFLSNIRGKRKDDGTWERPPMDADEAAEKASTTVVEYYKKEGGGELYQKGKREEGRYLKIVAGEGADGSPVINDFPNFDGGIKDFTTEKTKFSNTIRDLQLTYGGTKVSKFKVLGKLIPSLSEDVLKSQEPFGVRIDDKTKLAAQQLRMTPTDLINAQRKLYNLEPLSDKLTLNISNKDYNNLLYNPTPNTSTRALASHNKEQFDPTSVPGGWGYTFETVVPGSENMAAALTEAINENWDLVPEDIDDLQNIIEQGGDWNTLYSLLTEQGIDGHQLNKCAFKYGVKDSNGLPVTCVRPTLQIAN